MSGELERAKKDPKTRVEAAMALMISGASFSDIARMLEYESPARAKAAVERMLASTVGIEDKKSLRSIQAMRYETLLKSVMPRATNVKETNQLAYNQRASAIIDRIVALHGLNAPTQIQITPSDEYLEQYTLHMKQSLGLDTDSDPEADILEEGDFDE